MLTSIHLGLTWPPHADERLATPLDESQIWSESIDVMKEQVIPETLRNKFLNNELFELCSKINIRDDVTIYESLEHSLDS